ncbi:S-adenosyl-L-methionine-dependent methyltransferase [Xylariaceae sp. FL0804]|nr:S-adenosyl-L-methionine-dependent methyltransferase [Xylariaceae sp. FL0804]
MEEPSTASRDEGRDEPGTSRPPPPPPPPTTTTTTTTDANHGGAAGEETTTGAATAPPQPQEAATAAPHQHIIDELQIDSQREFGGVGGGDYHDDDNDSSMGSDVSSVDYEFRFEGGRRYQAANAVYHLPNDVQEMDRLELQHLIWMAMLGGRYSLAPLDESKLTHVLDVGCGTGNWTIEFANLHPEVQVLGTDLSPIQPAWVPTNCSFVIDDAANPWHFHQRFDYVHTRALSLGIADWDRFVAQAADVLQPGGWLELQEMSLPLASPDGSLRRDHALWAWGERMRRACALRLGVDSTAARGHADRLRRRGFVDVAETPLLVPLGPWARGEREKRIGWMGRKDLYEGIDGISRKLFSLLGDSEDDISALLERAKEEL